MKIRSLTSGHAAIILNQNEISSLIESLSSSVLKSECKEECAGWIELDLKLRIIKDILDVGEITASTIDLLCESGSEV